MGRWFYRAIVVWWLVLITGTAVFWTVAAVFALLSGQIGPIIWTGAIAAFVVLVPFRLTMADKPWRNL
jgi:hypothetical protein